MLEKKQQEFLEEFKTKLDEMSDLKKDTDHLFRKFVKKILLDLKPDVLADAYIDLVLQEQNAKDRTRWQLRYLKSKKA